MIAEESGKWVAEFSKCKTKRELDAALAKLAASEMIPFDGVKEPYDLIADRLGLVRGTNVRDSFDRASARVHRIHK